MTDFNSAFNAGENGISLNDKVGIFEGDADPSIAPGLQAPIGSLYLRTNGSAWQKTFNLDTDWQQLALAAGPGISIHAQLQGLLNDDHAQYAKTIGGERAVLDVNTPVANQWLKYDGAKWINSDQTLGGSHADALITNPTNGDIVIFNGATNRWENQQLIGGPVVEGIIRVAASGPINALSASSGIPYDNTTPLITEGTQLWTQDITTASANSKTVIMINGTVEVSTSNKQVVLAFFRNSTCIGVSITNLNASGRPQSISALMNDSLVAQGTYTYSCRVGVAGAGSTWYFNREVSPYFNGLLAANGYLILNY